MINSKLLETWLKFIMSKDQGDEKEVVRGRPTEIEEGEAQSEA